MLQADELEEAFTELVLQYKHDSATGTTTTTTTTATATPASTDESSGNSRLLLPARCLAAWAPVQKMVRSGAAIDEDVAAATAKAVKASSHSHHQHHHQGGGVQDHHDAGGPEGGMVDFVGFLEFIHSLDIEVRPSTMVFLC